MKDEIRISVVIPVYRSAGCLDELVRRLVEVLETAGGSYEIILVNDRSPDESWARICENVQRYPAVRGINLRRNVGQDNALMAGLRAARGAVVVMMDDDLQHDPRDIPRLVAAVEAGHDICYARFPRKHQAFWKNLGSWFNDKVANIVVGKPPHIYLSPFKAVARAVVSEVVQYDGPFPYVDGLLFRVTNNVTQVDVEHHRRYAGRGNYTLARSIGVWLRVATMFSLAPLRIATILGFTFSVVGFLLAVFFTVYKLLVPTTPLGWASTIVAILVLGGTQLACLGIIGEYVGRVFLHLNKRPQYTIKERVGA